MWFNSTDGTTYIYYNDGTSAQWVESTAPVTGAGYVSPNYIINGAFDINQRAFTSTTTNNTYGFDRWKFGGDGTGTVTHSAQAFTPGAAPVAGYEGSSFARFVTSGQSLTTAYTVYAQGIEDVRTLAGQTATISFWAKAATGTPKIVVELQQNFGSGGSPSSDVFTVAGQVTLTTSWTRYSITYIVPSIAGKTIGTTANTSVLYVNLWMSAGSSFNTRTNSIGIQSNTFDFWGIQVEQGVTATAFRRNANSIQGELAACQRYYETAAFAEGFGLQGVTSTGYVFSAISFKATKRTAPTTITTWDAAGTINTVTRSNLGVTSTNGASSAQNNITTSGMNVYSSGTSTATNISFSWAASAEL